MLRGKGREEKEIARWFRELSIQETAAYSTVNTQTCQGLDRVHSVLARTISVEQWREQAAIS